MAEVKGVRFEHYHEPNTLGLEERRPRLSWTILGSNNFRPSGYEIELYEDGTKAKTKLLSSRVSSPSCTLVPWPFDEELISRQSVSIRIRAYDENQFFTAWSEFARVEIGLLNREDWKCERITAPWAPSSSGPAPEHLYRKEFTTNNTIEKARLYITAQGVYEAEINGQRIGDHFMAPGWTAYDGRLQYQTYDVTSKLSHGSNCLGVRVAEGWFCGRIGFEGGHRNIWGPHPSLIAQLEIIYSDGRQDLITTNASWAVAQGPIRLAEIYDGEKYDATLEIDDWSSPFPEARQVNESDWSSVTVLPALPDSVVLTTGFAEPVRRITTVQVTQVIQTPSGKTVVDFGQNLVGYVRLKNINGPRGHKITLHHAEVMENGELCTRPLRICKAIDEYTIKGSEEETYEPRFTFHGFRFVQIDGWCGAFNPTSIEAVVCHTDMKEVGSFSCSDTLLNKLYQNVFWGMRTNFLSVPTDCPQRDERLGWTGDLAVFAPTAALIYDCFGMLKNWLVDLEHDQGVLGGVPPMVSPNATLPDPIWCRRVPCAIWHDATISVPWALYQETGDTSILAQQYNSMVTWMNVLPRNKTGSTHLWDNSVFQLGDWLDPSAPPDQPWKSASDARMIANMFLIQSLDLMAKCSDLLGLTKEKVRYEVEAMVVRKEFHDEYVTANGRIVSDSQAAYAIAICLNILRPDQRVHAANRLVYLVRKNNFRIATGFAGTPYICEALAITGHIQVAYAMLTEKSCPSWLYTVIMGGTTLWERWDSMLPDGSVNPGEMTSFNHYAFGSIAKFLYERVAGLQRVDAGWKTCLVAPAIGADFTQASASHMTPNGIISCSWKTKPIEDGKETMYMTVTVPRGTVMEVVLPTESEEQRQTVGFGEWDFQTTFRRDYEWPVLPLKPKS